MLNQDQGQGYHALGSRPPSNEEPVRRTHEEQAPGNQNLIKDEKDISVIVRVEKEETTLVSVAGTPPQHDQGSSSRSSPVQIKKEETPSVSLADVPLIQGQQSPERLSPRKTKRIDYNELGKTGAKVEKK